MKRLLCALVLLAACAPLAHEPRSEPGARLEITPPAAALPPIATAAPAIAETPDDPFRYRPPAPAARVAFAPPRPEEIALANGARALLVERHQLPMVTIAAVIRWKLPPPLAGMRMVLAALLADTAPGGVGLPLRLATGIDWKVSTDADASILRFSVLASELEPALRALVDVLERPALTAEKLEADRAQRLGWLAAETADDKLWRRVDGWLYPAGHAYRGIGVTEESLKKLTVAQLEAYRKAALGPDAVTFCVAGDVTRAALGGILERVVAPWSAAGTSPRAAAVPVKVASGALLVEEPGADPTRVVILSPAPLAESADAGGDAAEFAVQKLLHTGSPTHLTESVKGHWRAWDGIFSRRERRWLYLNVEVPPGGAVGAVQAYLAELGALAAGEFPDDALEQARRRIALQQEGLFDGSLETARSLTLLPLFDLPLDVRAERYRASIGLRREDVRKAAEAHLVKSELRVVVVGDLAGTKEGLEKLGIGRVVVEKAKAAPPAGAKK